MSELKSQVADAMFNLNGSTVKELLDPLSPANRLSILQASMDCHVTAQSSS